MYKYCFLTLHLLHSCNNTPMYIVNWFACQKDANHPSQLHVTFLNGNSSIKFDYELSHNKLKHYPRVLVRTVLINFTRTDNKLASTFTINIGFTKTLDTV